MSPHNRNVIVGATVLGGALVFGWLLLEFSARAAQAIAPPQIPIHFTCTRADGLFEGSTVSFLGVTVGRVTGVSRDAAGTGVVIDTMINIRPPMPHNIDARVLQTNLIGGGSNLDLTLQSPVPTGELAANDTLPAKYVGIQLDFMPAGVTQMADQIGKMSEQIRLLSEQASKSGLVGDLDATVKNYNAQATRAGKVLDSVQSIVGDPKTRQNLQQAIADIRDTAAATNKVAAKLDKLTDTLSANTQDLNKQVGDRLTQISTVMTSVQSIMVKLDTGKGTAGQLVNDPQLYQSLVDTSRELSAAATDLHRLIDQWEQEGVSLKLK